MVLCILLFFFLAACLSWMSITEWLGTNLKRRDIEFVFEVFSPETHGKGSVRWVQKCTVAKAERLVRKWRSEATTTDMPDDVIEDITKMRSQGHIVKYRAI